MIFLAVLRLCLGAAALGLGSVAIAAWFGFLVPFFDLFNHFQVLLIGGAVLLLLAVLLGFSGSPWRLPLLLVLLVGLAGSAITVVPETLAALAPRPAAPTDGQPVLKLMTHNLYALNYDMARVARVVADENPDILALQEYFPPQRQGLDRLLQADFPYSIHCVGGKRANIALYSKLPFDVSPDGDCSDEPVAGQRTAHILATFTLAGGTQFSGLNTHFDWPYPIERQLLQRQAIATAVNAVMTPLLVVGDFNSTPWSYAQRQFAKAAGLVRETHGILTWPLPLSTRDWRASATVPFLPLDQVMQKGAITIHSLAGAPPTGSDHLALVVTFSVQPAGVAITPAPAG